MTSSTPRSARRFPSTWKNVRLAARSMRRCDRSKTCSPKPPKSRLPRCRFNHPPGPASGGRRPCRSFPGGSAAFRGCGWRRRRRFSFSRWAAAAWGCAAGGRPRPTSPAPRAAATWPISSSQPTASASNKKKSGPARRSKLLRRSSIVSSTNGPKRPTKPAASSKNSPRSRCRRRARSRRGPTCRSRSTWRIWTRPARRRWPPR